MSTRPPLSYARPPADTWWAQLSSVWRHALCLGGLLAVAVAFYAPVLFEGKMIAGGDVVHWRAGAEALREYNAQTGDRALWTPNIFGGMPAYLTSYELVVPQLDTLVNALRAVGWPVGHVFVLMTGVYLLVVTLTRNALAGLVSALGFGFTTYIPVILAVGHETKFVALAYAPYVLLAFIYALRRPSILAGLLFAGALSLELRAKHPQITYGVMIVLAIWWLVEAVGAARDGTHAAFAKSTGLLAGGTVLALLMVAQPYLATYQYKQYSTRGAAGAEARWDGTTPCDGART